MDQLPAATTLPVIDFAPFREGGPADRRDVAARIGAACEEVGFFYLTGHGVPPDRLDAIFDAARSFFSLPPEVLQGIRATRHHYRGFMPAGVRGYGEAGLADLYEAFKMQIELPPDDPDLLAGKPLHQPNKWPPGLPAWRATVLDYWAEMMRLSHDLLAAFALALDQAEDVFLPFYRKPLAQLSLLHYPPQPPTAPEDQWGIRPHADTGAFTILGQDETGGLQVQHRGGSWIEATPRPGSYVINIGNMMARWTNGRFASTPHRVVNRTGRDRISVPFFMNPDYDAVIAPLADCVTAARPLAYEPLEVGPFIANVFSTNWKD